MAKNFNPDDPKLKKEIIHTSGSAGGVLVGRRHSEGGIKMVNKSNGQLLEAEGGEVIITRNAVSDDKKYMFEGKMMTNREILSTINERAGGVSFAKGGKVADCACSGHRYQLGGETMTDYHIVERMRRRYPDEFNAGVKEELSEHRGTFGRIKREKISATKAAELLVAEHLSRDPNYYNSKYERGGMIKFINKSYPSLPEFIKVGEPIKSPYVGENDVLYFPLYDKYIGKVAYFKGGRRTGHKISALSAYKSYLYDTFGLVFSDLPASFQNALTLGKQSIIDNYISS